MNSRSLRRLGWDNWSWWLLRRSLHLRWWRCGFMQALCCFCTDRFGLRGSALSRCSDDNDLRLKCLARSSSLSCRTIPIRGSRKREWWLFKTESLDHGLEFHREIKTSLRKIEEMVNSIKPRTFVTWFEYSESQATLKDMKKSHYIHSRSYVFRAP
jgi:hypothetical protein